MASNILRKIYIGNKKGQTLVEYSLVLVCVSLVAISVMSAMGSQVKGAFTTMTSQLASANGSGSGSGGSGGSGGGTPTVPSRNGL